MHSTYQERALNGKTVQTWHLDLHCFINPGRVGEWTSSETLGHLVVAGKRLNGRAKNSGEEKSRKKEGAPGILLLNDQFRNHLKSLPVIGHKNIFCAQSESSSFRVTFVTSYSKLFTAKHFARLIAILILTCSCRRVSLDQKTVLGNLTPSSWTGSHTQLFFVWWQPLQTNRRCCNGN